MIIDTHCHVYDGEMENAEEIIKQAMDNDIHLILNGTDFKSNNEVLKLAEKYDNVHAALGYFYTLADEITDEEFMEALNVSGFKHEPGGTVANCTTDMHILAMIIEKITGESYSEYVKKNIFDVCGMEHTSSMAVGDLTSVPDPEMGGDAVVIEMPNTLRGVWDIHSCSADMLSFDRALMHDKLISFLLNKYYFI